MPALNVPLIGESQSALHRRVAERNPGTWTPARREKLNTPRSARVVGTCAPQTWEPTSPRGHPRWAPGAHLRGATAPVLDAGPPAAGKGVRGFPTLPSGWKRWLLPGATSASQEAGVPAGPRARDPRKPAAGGGAPAARPDRRGPRARAAGGRGGRAAGRSRGARVRLYRRRSLAGDPIGRGAGSGELLLTAILREGEDVPQKLF